MTKKKPGQPPKYPFRGMKIGQTIELPYEDASRLRAAASAYCKYHGLKWKFRQKRDGDKVIFERIK